MRVSTLVRFLALVLVAGSATVVSAPAAASATFTVNSTAEGLDATPGDSRCATAQGQCTFRAAIMETNALDGADTIIVPAGTYTIGSFSGGEERDDRVGDFDIAGPLTIQGAGAATTVIDGDATVALERVFHLLGDAQVLMSGVTIQNGRVNTGCCRNEGGGIYANSANLTLRDVVVRNNGAPAGSGGGVYFSSGQLVIERSLIEGNTADLGGGVAIDDGATVQITDSTIRGNTARGGGGISAYGSFGTTRVARTTISGNTAQSGGGISNGSTINVVNSTISGNRAEGDADPVVGALGGGLFNLDGSTATLTNVTLAANTGGQAGATLYNQRAGQIRLTNTIVARGGSFANCAGTSVSQGYNLADDQSCGLAAVGDQTNIDPHLGPLQLNGGTTATHALLPGSPAIDAGTNQGCPATDQRGVVRPLGVACDIGAYERFPLQIYVPIVMR